MNLSKLVCAATLFTFFSCSHDSPAIGQGAIVENNPVYVTNLYLNTVSLCNAETPSSFTDCIQMTAGGLLNQPSGMAINPAGTRMYITNEGDNTVTFCEIASSGDLQNCISLAASEGLNLPEDIKLNAAGTHAFIADYVERQVVVCPINVDGTFGDCDDYNTLAGDSVFGIGFNSDESFLYVTNAGSAILKCPVFVGGVLGACTPAVASTDNTTNVAIDPTNTFAFLSVAGSSNLRTCTVNIDGTLSACFYQATPGSNMFGINISADGTHLYTGTTSASLYHCDLNPATGVISNCTAIGSGFDGPETVVFN